MKWLVACLVLLAGCLTDHDVACGELECPVGQVCIDGACASADAVAACAAADNGAPCASITVANGICRDGACRQIACGNGFVDPGEVCDDGNTMPGDGCSADCTSTEACGNGVVDTALGEECDDRNRLSNDGCSSTCTLEHPTWVPISTVITGRSGTAMVYDDMIQLPILFGGNSDATVLGDTWVHTFQSGWTRIEPVVSPPPRTNAAIAYDSVRQRVVLFGGFGETGLLADTWEFDGLTWIERPGALAPPARDHGAMVYDTVRARTVLYGGRSGVATAPELGDTWEWDGATWSKAQPTTSPPPVYGHAMTYDGAHVVLYGGARTGAATSYATWDYDGTTWTQRAASTVPTAGAFCALTYDPPRNRLVMIGGYDDTLLAPTLAVWEWTGAGWTKQVSNDGVPEGRLSAGIVFDVSRSAELLFGGTDQHVLADTVVWQNGSANDWLTIDYSIPDSIFTAVPSERGFASMSFDYVRGGVMLYGGISHTNSWDDTWVLRDGGWSRGDNAATPFARWYSPSASDWDRRRIVVFGGFGFPGNVAPAGLFDDTWEWDSNEDGTKTYWRVQTPATSPPARLGHVMAYDAATKTVVMFGGTDESSELDDTWEWNGTTWRQLAPLVSPPGRDRGAMAYDPVRERAVMFGGFDGNGLLGDTWEWDGTTWTEMTPPSSPPARIDHALAYDPQRRRIVLYGGFGDTLLADTWEWDGATWTQLEPLSPPPAREGMSMAYDAIDHQMVMFGGEDFNTTFQADAWVLRWQSRAPIERCIGATLDDDGDGLAGCADPDCFARCAPSCAPGAPCDPASPRCGDGVCSLLEDSSICPADCTP